MSIPKIICVDFDGTVCGFAYPDIGPLKPGVREALTKFRELGYHIVVYSCRTCGWFPEVFNDSSDLDEGTPIHPSLWRRVVAMREFLDANSIPYDEIDDGKRGKPPAAFYIDDKGVRFDNNWPEIQKFVEGVTQ